MKKRQIYNKINKSFYSGKNQEFMKVLLRDSLEFKDFNFAQKLVLQLKYKKDYVIQFFAEMSKYLKENESDLALTRIIFMKIALQKTAEAFYLFKDFENDPILKNSLLKELLTILFESLRLRSQIIFQEILESFANTIGRDQELEKILKKIGTSHLGMKFQGSFDIMNMMSNLIS